MDGGVDYAGQGAQQDSAFRQALANSTRNYFTVSNGATNAQNQTALQQAILQAMQGSGQAASGSQLSPASASQGSSINPAFTNPSYYGSQDGQGSGSSGQGPGFAVSGGGGQGGSLSLQGGGASPSSSASQLTPSSTSSSGSGAFISTGDSNMAQGLKAQAGKQASGKSLQNDPYNPGSQPTQYLTWAAQNGIYVSPQTMQQEIMANNNPNSHPGQIMGAGGINTHINYGQVAPPPPGWNPFAPTPQSQSGGYSLGGAPSASPPGGGGGFVLGGGSKSATSSGSGGGGTGMNPYKGALGTGSMFGGIGPTTSNTSTNAYSSVGGADESAYGSVG